MPALMIPCGELASGVGLPNLGPSAAELALANLSTQFGGSLVEWWSGGAGLTINGLSSEWQGRVKGYKLVPSYVAAPVEIAAAINSRTAIGFPSNCGMKDNAGKNLLPASGDWTVAMIYKGTSVGAQNRSLICDASALLAAGSYFMHRSDGKFEYRRNGVQMGVTTATLATGTPSTLLMGWKNSATRFTARKDGAQIQTGTIAQSQGSSVFGLGHASTTSGFGSTATAGNPDLFAEVLVFNLDLTDAANAATLATVETHLRTLGATW